MAAGAAEEVETKVEVEAKADFEASVIEDDSDMACQWLKGIRPA